MTTNKKLYHIVLPFYDTKNKGTKIPILMGILHINCGANSKKQLNPSHPNLKGVHRNEPGV